MRTKIILATSLFAVSCGLYAAGSNNNLTEARSVMKQFGMGLKGHLQSAMKAGGPIEAIEACNVKAPGVADYMSQKSGWDVARTSLKIRNPGNQPDDWELKVLNHFEAEKAKGADPKKLEFSEVVESDGKKTFRYMKAIPTGKVCLHCHSGEIKPEVAAQLEKLYPTDKAKGFKVGDIRGAFTLQKQL